MQNRSKVVLRIRPVTPTDSGQKTFPYELTPSSVTLAGQSFSFDKVLPPDSTQAQLCNYLVPPILDALAQGRNSSVVIAGNLAGGKTLSLFGQSNFSSLPQRSELPNRQRSITQSSNKSEAEGVMAKLANDLFAGKLPGDVYVSFVEVYKQTLTDLMSPGRRMLKIHQRPLEGIYVQNLTEYRVSSAQQVLRVLRKGEKQRKVRTLKDSPRSSRSHAIFTVIVEWVQMAEGLQHCHRSKASLVDLACTSKHLGEKESQELFEESVSINKGLNALGRIINCLNDKGMPVYKESVLTSLLKDTFCADSQRTVVLCLNPALALLRDAVQSLRTFAKVSSLRPQPKSNVFKLPLIRVTDYESKRSRGNSSLLKYESKERRREGEPNEILKRLQQLQLLKLNYRNDSRPRYVPNRNKI